MSEYVHRRHLPSFEDGVLDSTCERCAQLQIGDLSDVFLRKVLGMTREEFDQYTDPSLADQEPAASLPPAVRTILYAFRYRMRKANALQIEAEVEALSPKVLLP